MDQDQESPFLSVHGEERSILASCLHLRSCLEGHGWLQNLLVFLLWTVTSFLCHFCAKTFLSVQAEDRSEIFSDDHEIWREIFNACLLTFIQILLCYFFVDVSTSGSSGALKVARITHVLATLATNISMAMMFASSTFAIKLMEPITSAITQYCMLGTPLSPVAIISLPVIVGGAIAFSGNPLSETRMSYGIAAAFASNIILAVRNVAIKGSSSNHKTKMTLTGLDLKNVMFIVMCFSGLHYLDDASKGAKNITYSAAMCFLSGVFHVCYSYVSTGMVLTQLSVVSHAVANIMKRVLVVLLLYACGQRVASPYNFLGLVVCTLGLLLYAWDKSRRQVHSSPLDKGHAHPSMPWRSFLRYLMYLTAAGMMTLYIVDRQVISVKEVRDSIMPGNGLPVLGKIDSRYLRDLPKQSSDRFDFTFTNRAHDKQNLADLEPDLTGYLANHSEDIQSFLHEDIYKKPNISGFISEKLRTHVDIIKEAQRLQFDVLGKALRKYKYAVLLDIASFENKGDPCITIGEIYYLARTHLDILYYCNFHACVDQNLQKARILVSNYTTDEMVILVHGGGNLVGYANNDILRFKILKLFAGYHMFVFPQSMWVRNFKHPHLQRCAENYCCNENITLVLRDLQSYEYAKTYFNGTSTLLMAPDMAFQIGPVDRFMSPVFDIMWIKRKDGETPGYDEVPKYRPGLRVHVSDWWPWTTNPAGSSLEKAFYICTNGFFYLQRGRVVITDRLHGHIMSTLMNIPHVLIDNKAKKLSAYHRTWTKSLENTVITDDPKKALDLAVKLLDKYNDVLPPRVPFLNISENFRPIRFNRPDTGYV